MRGMIMATITIRTSLFHSYGNFPLVLKEQMALTKTSCLFMSCVTIGFNCNIQLGWIAPLNGMVFFRFITLLFLTNTIFKFSAEVLQRGCATFLNVISITVYFCATLLMLILTKRLAKAVTYYWDEIEAYIVSCSSSYVIHEVSVCR